MNFQWLFEHPIAHRGLHDETYPENSIPAYQRAIERGYNIEIDVHVTTDGHVVVFHDDNLKRVCGVDRTVKSCSLAEIKSFRLLGTEYTIPTFEEFLQLVDGKVGILCEIKGINPFDNSIVKATIEALKNYKGNIALQSFNFGAVRYAKRHSDYPAGELCTWCAANIKKARWWATDFMGKLWVCRLSNPDFIAYDVRACNDDVYPENKYLIKWSKKLPVIMWTVNSEKTMKHALKYANNIIFENLSPDYVNSQIGGALPFRCKEQNLPSNK